MIPQYLYTLWIAGGIAALAGLGLLAAARVMDRRNYIIQRATPMPLTLVNERDDVWLRGQAETDAPVIAPHFGFHCLHYEYKLEERVRKTRTTKDGKTETYHTWETRERKSDAARFRLLDGDLSIEINGRQAEFKGLQSETDREGEWRHTVEFLSAPIVLSAVGSVSEKRERLEPYANIPLMVTPQTREEFVASAERGEAIMRGVGFFLFWAGAGAAFYGLFDYTSWPSAAAGRFNTSTAVAAAAAATLVFVPLWALYIYNTFVTYRLRVDNAWRQIDVDLKMRYNLIPQLVSAVQGYMKHEQQVLKRVTELRSQAVAGGPSAKIAVEMPLVGAIQNMRVVVENYPDLKAQPVVAKLTREMKAIEEKIAHGRKTYNEAVREYNENVQCFPRLLIARPCGFGERPFFAAVGEEREAQRV